MFFLAILKGRKRKGYEYKFQYQKAFESLQLHVIPKTLSSEKGYIKILISCKIIRDGYPKVLGIS